MADNQVTAGRPRSVDHRATFIQGQRHRLLDERMLARGKGKTRMLRMELVRRRNVQHFERRIGAQLFHRRIGTTAKVALELRARLGARVGRGDQRDARVGRERGRHQRERASEAGDADTHCLHRGRGGIIAKYLGT